MTLARVSQEPPPSSSARLAELDDELYAAVPASDRPVADRVVLALRHSLPAGPWSPAELLSDPRSPATAIVVQGVIVRDVELGGRTTSDLLGPGDFFRLGGESSASPPTRTRWTCGSGGAVVGVLNRNFPRASARWPGLSAVIEARLTAQLEAAMLRTAIMSLPRAEHRILALMWQLADRWGVVTVEGVAVRLELTHELLGRLTGARRPTVSLALHLLEEQRALSRAAPGVWLLAHDSCEMIERPSRPAPVVPIGN